MQVLDSSGTVIASFESVKTFQSVVPSDAALEDGATYTVTVDGQTAATVTEGVAAAGTTQGGAVQGDRPGRP